MNKIEKRHALRKRVKREKARLRRRGLKKHSRYEKMVKYRLNLSPEVLEKVMSEAKRRGISPQRVIREVLKKMTEVDWGKLKDGVQKESDIKMDEGQE